MHRDWDLIRKILLAIEAEEKASGLGTVEFEKGELGDYSEEAISYHVLLLGEAGLIDAMDASTFDGLDVRPRRLTWSGHEFLEASRDESRWQQAKFLIREKGAGLTASVLQRILLKLAEGSLGI